MIHEDSRCVLSRIGTRFCRRAPFGGHPLAEDRLAGKSGRNRRQGRQGRQYQCNAFQNNKGAALAVGLVFSLDPKVQVGAA